MTTERYDPPDDLKPYVKSYFVQEVDLQTDGVLIPALTQTLLQFNYGQLFALRDSAGTVAQFHPVTLTGISTTYWSFHTAGPVSPRFLAVDLHPYVPYLLFRDKITQIINSSINASELFEGSTEHQQALAAANDPNEKVQLTTAYLRSSLLSTPQFDDAETIEALAMMDAPAEYETIESRLSRLAGNPRSFRRKFKRIIGIAPKLYMRIRRMEKVLAEMHEHPDAHYLQKTHGFYDQPHLIRECKLFTGRTPATIFQAFQQEEVRRIHNNLSQEEGGEGA